MAVRTSLSHRAIPGGTGVGTSIILIGSLP
jgi:hypothetical protein